MRAIALLLAVGLPTAASAQTATEYPPARHDLAPWWMKASVTPSLGLAETSFPANRASITARFQVVDKSSAEATRLAAEKVATLSTRLRAFGADKARVETAVAMEPIYEQYRDREGDLISNERADKIEGYKVEVEVSIEVRDVSVVEEVYSTVLAARPTYTDPVRFSLEADNAATTALFRSAVADARNRAVLAAQATGAQLGPVKMIDSSGRACSSPTLLEGPTDYEEASVMSSIDRKRRAATLTDSIVQDTIVVGARARRTAADAELRPEDMRLPLQAPLMPLSSKACVIFSLSAG